MQAQPSRGMVLTYQAQDSILQEILTWILTEYSLGPWILPYKPKPTTKIRLFTMNLQLPKTLFNILSSRTSLNIWLLICAKVYHCPFMDLFTLFYHLFHWIPNDSQSDKIWNEYQMWIVWMWSFGDLETYPLLQIVHSIKDNILKSFTRWRGNDMPTRTDKDKPWYDLFLSSKTASWSITKLYRRLRIYGVMQE